MYVGSEWLHHVSWLGHLLASMGWCGIYKYIYIIGVGVSLSFWVLSLAIVPTTSFPIILMCGWNLWMHLVFGLVYMVDYGNLFVV